MQALKALVILMAVLIMAGMGLLVYGLATRGPWSKGADKTPPTAAGSPVAPLAAVTAFGDVAVPMPDGCTIAGTELAGTRLVLRLDGLAERGCRQVVVVDLAGGRVLGRVKAVSQPAQ